MAAAGRGIANEKVVDREELLVEVLSSMEVHQGCCCCCMPCFVQGCGARNVERLFNGVVFAEASELQSLLLSKVVVAGTTQTTHMRNDLLWSLEQHQL